MGSDSFSLKDAREEAVRWLKAVPSCDRAVRWRIRSPQPLRPGGSGPSLLLVPSLNPSASRLNNTRLASPEQRLQLLTRGPHRHISGSARSRFIVWGRVYWPGIQAGCPTRCVTQLCAEKKALPFVEGSALSTRYCDCC